MSDPSTDFSGGPVTVISSSSVRHISSVVQDKEWDTTVYIAVKHVSDSSQWQQNIECIGQN